MAQPHLQEEWKKILALWGERSRMFGFLSERFTKTQQMLLPLLLCPAQKRTEVFLQLAGNAKLRFSTMKTYAVALKTATDACGLPQPADVGRLHKYLEAQEGAEMAQNRQCANPEDVKQWTTNMTIALGTEGAVLAAIVWLTFLLGQRLSDVVRLQARSLTTFPRHRSVTFFEGKVVPKIGPFSVNFKTPSPTSQLAIAWEQLQHVAQSQALPTDYLVQNPKMAQEKIVSFITKDVRSLRRGGLTMMALSGATMEQLLIFSKHASEKMLMKYILHGAALAQQAEETESVFKKVNSLYQKEGMF